jgi:signal transduction histidine kinase
MMQVLASALTILFACIELLCSAPYGSAPDAHGQNMQTATQLTSAASLQAARQRVELLLDSGLPQKIDTTLVNELLWFANASISNQARQALAAARLALSAAERLQFKSGMARAYNHIGMVHRFYDQYDSASIYSRKALALYEEIHDLKGIGEAYNALGGVYVSRGKHGLALEQFLQARMYAERVKSDSLLASALSSMGAAYRQQGDIDMALKLHYRSLALRQRSGSERMIAISLQNLAADYLEKHRYDSAIYYYRISRELFRRAGDQHGTALNTGGIGSALTKQGFAKQALDTLVTAAQQMFTLGDKRGFSIILLAESSALLAQQRLSEALRIADSAYRIASAIGATHERKEAYLLLSSIYAAQGNLARSFAFFKLYDALKDSMASDENREAILALQTRYETQRKNEEIAALKHQSDVEAIRSRNWQIVLGLGMILLIGMTLLVANRYRLKKRSELALQETNRRILEQQAALERSNAQLTELNNEKNEILGIVAHDLKNPLSNIKMLSKVLYEGSSNLSPEEIAEFSQDIQHSAHRMFEMINTLLDANALERGGVRVDIHVFDIVPIVNAVIHDYQARAAAKSITLHPEASLQQATQSGTVINILADMHIVYQMLDNLVSNAVKYSPYESTVRLNVLTNAEEIQEHQQLSGEFVSGNNTTASVLITVADEGPGITQEDRARLFGKFARLSAKPTGGEHSTGLGLSIVKKMAEMMNGRVWCESQPERGIKGAVFVLQLPAA